MNLLRVFLWVETHDDAGNFPPIGTVSVGIEQAQIADAVRPIVFRRRIV